jgi:hypothetical protein
MKVGLLNFWIKILLMILQYFGFGLLLMPQTSGLEWVFALLNKYKEQQLLTPWLEGWALKQYLNEQSWSYHLFNKRVCHSLLRYLTQ